MQLMIDTDTETPENLRLIAGFILGLCDKGTRFDAPPVGETTGESIVVPLVPPPPPPPAGAAATAADILASANVRTDLSLPPSSQTTSAPPAPPSPPASAEYDASGMPWDERIHQKGKNKKRDGTWKLKKNADPAIVQAVVSELAARRQPFGLTSQPAATPSAHVNELSFDPAKVFGGENAAAPLPPGAMAPPPPVAPAAPPVPLPPAAAIPMGAPTPGVISFRDLVAKIIAGTKSGKFTTDQVTAIVQASGAPSLQVLSTMANLIPQVNAQIDALFAA